MGRPVSIYVNYRGRVTTIPEIAAETGVPRQTIRKAAADVTGDISSRIEELVERASARAKNAAAQRALAQEHGISVATLWKRKAAGRQGADLIAPTRRGKRPGQQLLTVLFRGSEMTIQEAADAAGCSRALIERAMKRGRDVTAYVERGRLRTTAENIFTEEWIWSRVAPDPNSGCWLWTRGESLFGYGLFSFGEYGQGAHKAFYQRFVGPVPDGMYVLHKCDVPQCCNPDHLWLGTHLENVADCVAKGRNVRGEMQPHAKLNRDLIALAFAMRADGIRTREIAAEVGTSRELVRDLFNGKKWKHVTGEYLCQK